MTFIFSFQAIFRSRDPAVLIRSIRRSLGMSGKEKKYRFPVLCLSLGLLVLMILIYLNSSIYCIYLKLLLLKFKFSSMKLYLLCLAYWILMGFHLIHIVIVDSVVGKRRRDN